MAPTHQFFPREIIDLTRDDEEEEQDKDNADQAKALLDAFTKPKISQPRPPKQNSSTHERKAKALLDAFTRPRSNETRPLKRKSPPDETEVKVLLDAFTNSKVSDPRPFKRKSPTDGPEVRGHSNSETVFTRPQPATNGFNHTVDNASIGTSSARDRPVSHSTTPEHAIKRESMGPTPQPFVSLPPAPTVHPSISNRTSLSEPSSTRPQPASDSCNFSSRSSSVKSAFMAKKTPTPRHTRSPFVSAAIERTPKVMVVVPPPPTSDSSGGRSLSKRKINRLPSVSSESDEESDPDEPKGVKQKYYPLEMYELRAKRGRYPQVRSTNSDLQVLPIRSSPVHKSRQRAPHGRKIYLRELLEKKLRTIQGPPVKMARDWDGTGILASNFEFTNTYKLQQGVTRAPEGFNYGCDCGYQCDPTRCTCLSKEEDSEQLMVAYEHRNGKLLLKKSFINRKAMIYECSLEIFHTGDRGFGLRSPEFIHRGQFIDTYLGEVITSAEADLREDATGGPHSSPSYLFSLDWFTLSEEDDDEEIHEYEDEDNTGSKAKPYVVDGQRFGGPSRFMNHSCNPNCKMIPVSTHHGDQRIYDLAFFAGRDIPAGTELTFDYNPGWSPDMSSDDPNAVKCLCGEAQCRGQLWPNQRKSANV
ncbi:histone-lysine N-methyltransferase Clr4 [Talaromyces stipitatus ATCC 10500]|uniref:Histone-lysine N-methyltransferase Clr4 n=1 Tax=Talaromyces stipitatus (strain ATCC 10500 / CBS 375.48 / QM 6759 / NRRL 1006) TaxID=441959 RepID=B8LVN7_TALSN|nr:histone-lysine N-methyltransferase Clr4 [Talaromyces stipitatus ATCC 10500]EED24167.1 histone-lysine N-methyltransferase Clr4 [Talaromyces stipitatus ATCC 10500]